eukprot:Hpha_TRINITY_DN15773_c2_g3::TRINITY_DN15773_c2_g3_i1::g.38968::m.38968
MAGLPQYGGEDLLKMLNTSPALNFIFGVGQDLQNMKRQPLGGSSEHVPSLSEARGQLQEELEMLHKVVHRVNETAEMIKSILNDNVADRTSLLAAVTRLDNSQTARVPMQQQDIDTVQKYVEVSPVMGFGPDGGVAQTGTPRGTSAEVERVRMHAIHTQERSRSPGGRDSFSALQQRLSEFRRTAHNRSASRTIERSRSPLRHSNSPVGRYPQHGTGHHDAYAPLPQRPDPAQGFYPHSPPESHNPVNVTVNHVYGGDRVSSVSPAIRRLLESDDFHDRD